MIRVLICDDHPVFAESLAELLGAAGMRVVGVAHDPDAAVTVLRREPVEVCLLDVMFGPHSVLPRLPELQRRGPETRIVLLTGRVDVDLVTAARRARVAGVANKRCLTREMVQLLHRVHAGERVFPTDAAPPPARPATAASDEEVRRLAAFLTPRERQTLSALVGGHDTRQIARTLGVTPATARCHIQRVLTKMDAHSRVEAATTAVRCGLVSPETGTWLLPVH
ncbi:two-component system, NarL family, nitrate/nitrite response regulator NarL [Micromonospora pattaloongensis]|uniref:Two-component system, NarL family, nitrate/nitrite response regulator NarL n=1 Tax=Micromonospora pattaloongensis TaxID=405436 RepID=A0A1H3NUQ6_9ACTN|nr:response regulator transcription factor [Micromonospora pattaloongensis]SDY92538.1 two-component system, NarL family, nitrate/nitrite response regulator NarL [Micromonospora pattaloongensis]